MGTSAWLPTFYWAPHAEFNSSRDGPQGRLLDLRLVGKIMETSHPIPGRLAERNQPPTIFNSACGSGKLPQSLAPAHYLAILVLLPTGL